MMGCVRMGCVMMSCENEVMCCEKRVLGAVEVGVRVGGGRGVEVGEMVMMVMVTTMRPATHRQRSVGSVGKRHRQCSVGSVGMRH